MKREFYTELVLLKPLFELKGNVVALSQGYIKFQKSRILNQQQHDKTKPEITKLIRSCLIFMCFI